MGWLEHKIELYFLHPSKKKLCNKKEILWFALSLECLELDLSMEIYARGFWWF